MNKEEWSCKICKKKFVNKSNLVRHARSIHRVYIKKNEKKIFCGICKLSFNFFKSLEEHLFERHNFTTKVERRVFLSIEGFQAYKKNLEESQASFFATTRKVGCKTYYACHLSGRSKSLTQERGSQEQKTRKINATCPARIEVDYKRGFVESFAQLNHFGHSCSIKFLRLRKEERAAIAAEIDRGISYDKILGDLRSSTDKNFSKRINLIKKKDLHNIAREFNLCKGDKYLNDAARLDKWVSKQNSENNPVLFYKKEGEASDNLEKEDFMLVLSTLHLKCTQTSSIKKILCDSTLGNNTNGYQLTVLLAINELENGLPLAYCISNKVDTKTMITFFQLVKKNYGECNVVFMADDKQASYDAWCQVMNMPSQRLLCAWHVFKTWKGKFGVWNEEKKQKILEFCKKLLHISNTCEFFSLLNEFLIYCNSSEETKDFGEYFVKTHASRPESWAYSYRTEKGFNTNLYLKSWHRMFKHCYSDGKKCRKIDKCINDLMNLAEVVSKRTVPENQKQHIFVMQKILEHHKESAEIPLSSIRKVKSNKWIVKGQSSNRAKIVQTIAGICQCSLKCPYCQVCVHQVSCTCLNFLICGIMCKHIHACASSLEVISTEETQSHSQESIFVNESTEILENIENNFDTTSTETRKKDVIKDLQLISDLIDIIPEEILDELYKFTSELLPRVVDFAAFELEHQQTAGKRPVDFLTAKKTKLKLPIKNNKSIIIKETIYDNEFVDDTIETQLYIHTEFDHSY